MFWNVYKMFTKAGIEKAGLQIRMFFFISIMPISSPNPLFDHLLESSHQVDSSKWLNIGFDEEKTHVE